MFSNKKITEDTQVGLHDRYNMLEKTSKDLSS